MALALYQIKSELTARLSRGQPVEEFLNRNVGLDPDDAVQFSVFFRQPANSFEDVWQKLAELLFSKYGYKETISNEIAAAGRSSAAFGAASSRDYPQSRETLTDNSVVNGAVSARDAAGRAYDASKAGAKKAKAWWDLDRFNPNASPYIIPKSEPYNLEKGIAQEEEYQKRQKARAKLFKDFNGELSEVEEDAEDRVEEEKAKSKNRKARELAEEAAGKALAAEGVMPLDTAKKIVERILAQSSEGSSSGKSSESSSNKSPSSKPSVPSSSKSTKSSDSEPPNIVFGVIHLLIFAFFVYGTSRWFSQGDTSWIVLGILPLIYTIFISGLGKEVSLLGRAILVFLLFIHGALIGIGFGFSMGLLVTYIFFIVVFVFLLAMKSGHLIDGESAQQIILFLIILPLVIYAFAAVAEWALEQGHITAYVRNLIILVVDIIPVAVVFLMVALSNSSETMRVILKAYKGVIILLVLFLAIVPMYNLAIANVSNARLPGADDPLGVFSELYESGREHFDDAIDNIRGTAERATDPGKYYTGTVEQNKKKPLGVTITSLRPQDKITDTESEVVVFGTVTAKSFVQDRIHVDPACVIDKTKPIGSTVEPPEGLNLIYGTSQTFECTFAPLTKGTQTITGMVTFPFETWAYIPYTFVDEERVKNLARQGRDVKEVFNIQETPQATYTSGPVIVGMGGSSQPVLVRATEDPLHPSNDIIPKGTKIGVTLDSHWDKGKLQEVKSWEIKVPYPFSLPKCDREITMQEPDPNEPLYTRYFFENPMTTANSYTSVTCDLAIDPGLRSEALALVSQGDKVERSFIAVANYTYTVEEKTTVTVKE